MGKRKKSSRKPQGPKKREPLPTNFACLFCNHEKSVSTKLDKKAGVGALSCKVCGQSFQCSVNYLSAPVDVYSEWVDACDVVAKHDPADGRDALPVPSRRRATVSSGNEDLDGVGDDELGDGYEGEGIVGDDEE